MWGNLTLTWKFKYQEDIIEDGAKWSRPRALSTEWTRDWGPHKNSLFDLSRGIVSFSNMNYSSDSWSCFKFNLHPPFSRMSPKDTAACEIKCQNLEFDRSKNTCLRLCHIMTWHVTVTVIQLVLITSIADLLACRLTHWAVTVFFQ